MSSTISQSPSPILSPGPSVGGRGGLSSSDQCSGTDIVYPHDVDVDRVVVNKCRVTRTGTALALTRYRKNNRLLEKYYKGQ